MVSFTGVVAVKLFLLEREFSWIYYLFVLFCSELEYLWAMQKQNKTTGAFLAVLLAGMSYGCLSTIVKYAYRDGLNAEIVSGTQVYFGFIFFAVLFLFHKLNHNFD